MVNKERLAIGVAALRSGQFEQGQGALCRLDEDTGGWRFCCLGVLCEVAIANGLDLSVDVIVHPDYPDEAELEYSGNVDILPYAVKEWYGLPDSDPPLGEESAAHCNDDLGYDFDTIADLFEKRYIKEEKP